MRPAAAPATEDERAEPSALDQAMVLIYLLSNRVSELEAQMRLLLGLEPPPPALGPDWMSLKQAAHLTGLSPSGLRSRISRGMILSRKLGGRVLVDRSSLPAGAERR